MLSRDFQAIIFDMDGLMVDTERLYWAVAREIAAQRNKTVPDATLRRMMGRSRLESIRIFMQECAITDRNVDQIADERDKLVLERFRAGFEPMPGLIEILKRFHGRLKLGVATSALRKFTDVILPTIGVDEFFQAVQTGDDIVNGKPDPEIYLKAMAQVGVEPARCIVLEDSRAGAMSGHRTGALVIAVPSHLTASDDFSFADARVENLNQASEIIAGMIPV
jgi:HAD superfamily hydrolase (TIGR01509 family)